MRAMMLRVHGEPLRLEDVPVPEPGPGEVLVRVGACGICGTDLKIAAGLMKGTRIPNIMGHEPAGEVAKVGPGVTTVKPGDRVFVHFYVTCGMCEFCLSGRETICRRQPGRVGWEMDGGFAEYLKVPAQNAIPVPQTVSVEEAALLGDAIGTAYHAVNSRARLLSGDVGLVMGAGGVGLHLVQVAKVAGARVIAVDIDDKKLEMARELGADDVVRYDAKTYVDDVRGLLGGDGVHAVFETVGLPETFERNLAVLRPAGRLVIIGYKPGTTFPVDPLRMLLDEVEILGSRAVTKPELQAVVRLVARGQVKPIITRRFKLEQVNEALEELRQGRIMGRAVILP